MTATRTRSRWAAAVATLALTVGLLLTAAVPTSAEPLATSAAATTAAEGCFVITFQNVRYCSATINQVKQSRYPTGQRVVLKAVSVTAVTSSTVTVSVGWPVFRPCPPGMFGGAGTSTWYQADLVVPWTGSGRPSTPSVIDLYGSVTPGASTPTVKPSAWTLRPGLCHVDWSAMGLC